MLSAIAVENRSCRVLLRRAPRGTPSSILALRRRRCFDHQKADSGRHTSQLRKFHGTPSLGYATARPPSLLSRDAMAYMQSLLARSNGDIPHGAAAPPHLAPTAGTVATKSPTPASHHTGSQSAGPFHRALSALREGNARRLLIHLSVVEHMSQEELRDAVATLPRTTFTEFFRALDPRRVARECDPADDSHVSVGMYKMLHMESSMDEWGVRKLFTSLLKQLLTLMRAMKMAGYTLHAEEYIALIRCAGACCDISGARALWNDMIAGPTLAWRDSELYTEYLEARFLTDPLYTNYQKITRMVTPRNLHRSRLQLRDHNVRRLDNLNYRVRSKRGLFGLNKDAGHVEELMRLLRGNRPALKLFRAVIATHSFRVDERLLCALMVALARSGSLRMIGTNILQKYFSITTPPTPLEAGGQWSGPSSEPPRIVPTVRLMRAVVETYGSNADIANAVRLVEHLSTTYEIPIPPDVWQDLMEWTYIMNTPPASTAWAVSGLYMIIPGLEAVEMIWNAMTGPPHSRIPDFRNYDLLVRSLIVRLRDDDPTQVLSRMREAVVLYDKQCQEYEAAAFDYVHCVRDGVTPSAVSHRFERARFRKQRMWYDISAWCRMFLKRTPVSEHSPIPHPLTPAFIEEFRPFLRNPIRYLTPTGNVKLVDPSLETFTIVQNGLIERTVRVRSVRRLWMTKNLRIPKLAVLSTHSLARFKAFWKPLTLIAPDKDAFETAALRPRPPAS